MNTKSRIIACLTAGGLAAAATFGASAQAPGYGEFRDPSGKVWTPENVGKDGSPVPYEDRAFDPRSQIAPASEVVVQRPRARLMGVVPVTSGPNGAMPIVTMDVSSLRTGPDGRWQAMLYVTNNSGALIEAVVGCRFSNNGQMVEDTRVFVPAAGPGERLGAPIDGPRTEIFVDKLDCRVLSPV